MENTTSSHKPYISDLDASIQAMRDADKVQAAPAEPEPAAAEKQPVQGQDAADVEDAEDFEWLKGLSEEEKKRAIEEQMELEREDYMDRHGLIPEEGVYYPRDLQAFARLKDVIAFPAQTDRIVKPLKSLMYNTDLDEMLKPEMRDFFDAVSLILDFYRRNNESFMPVKKTGISKEEFLEELQKPEYADKKIADLYRDVNGNTVENPLEADTPIRRIVEAIKGRKNSLQRGQQYFTAIRGIGERVYTFARKDLRQRLTSNYVFIVGPDGKEHPLPPDFPYTWLLPYTLSIMIKEKNYTGDIILHMPSAFSEAEYSLDFRKFDGQGRKEALAAAVRDIQHAFIDVKTRIDGGVYQMLNFKNEKGGEWEYVTFSSPALQKLFEKYVTGRQEIFKKKQAPKKIKDGKAQGGKKKAGSPSKGDIPSIFCHILKTSQLSSKYPAALEMAIELLGTVWERKKTPDADLRQNAHTDIPNKEGVTCHASLSTLSKACPQFLARLTAQNSTRAVNTFLKRHFAALESLLNEALEGFYKNVKVTIPPVSSTTWRDRVIVITHHGANKKRPLSDA